MVATGTVFVNDEPRPGAAGAALDALVREMGLTEKRGVAIAVNGAVVPRAAWAGRRLQAEDRVLVIQATQGG